MRIVVIGAGGVGACFGGELARAGHDVTMFARGAQLDALRRRGITVRTPEGEFTAPVTATDAVAELPSADLAVIAVKSYSLADIIPIARAVADRGADVLPLLNVLKARVREAHARQVLLRVRRAQAHQAIGIAVRERPQEHRVDDAEQRDIRADSQREAQDRRDGEAGRFQQLAECVAKHKGHGWDLGMQCTGGPTTSTACDRKRTPKGVLLGTARVLPVLLL